MTRPETAEPPVLTSLPELPSALTSEIFLLQHLPRSRAPSPPLLLLPRLHQEERAGDLGRGGEPVDDDFADRGGDPSKLKTSCWRSPASRRQVRLVAAVPVVFFGS